jgi:hypothetical protein
MKKDIFWMDGEIPLDGIHVFFALQFALSSIAFDISLVTVDSVTYVTWQHQPTNR